MLMLNADESGRECIYAISATIPQFLSQNPDESMSVPAIKLIFFPDDLFCRSLI